MPGEPVAGFSKVGVLRLFCENCVVQGMLGRKVYAEQRFTDTRSLGDLLSGRSGKAVCGKQRCCHAEQVGLPFMAGGWGRLMLLRSRCPCSIHGE